MNSVVFILGPTASGKTSLALSLAQHFDVEIISVDSALVYKGMDIGTSKPTADEMAIAPHHLIDILEPEQSYSAADFRQDALGLIEEIQGRGRIPLLVGGTMLYYRALEQGLSELPPSDETIRGDLEKMLEQHGSQYLHEELVRVDPVSAERIHPNDPQRITRALEVFRISGKPMSELWAAQTAKAFPHPAIRIGICPEQRSVLHQRIEQRFDQMLEQGFVAEVERLRQRPELNLSLPSMRCVGYRQVWQYLDGEFDYDTMRNKGVTTTRQLAKRQITWMRSYEGLEWFDSEDSQLLVKVRNRMQGTNF